MIVTSMFYTREEQTKRVGYWCTSMIFRCHGTSASLNVYRSPDERVCDHLLGLCRFWHFAHKGIVLAYQKRISDSRV